MNNTDQTRLDAAQPPNIFADLELPNQIVLSDRDYELFTKIMTEEHEPTELALRGAAGFMSGTMEGPRYRW